MDYEDFMYEEYLKDLENGETNLTFEEWLYYMENNINGVCVLN